MPSSQTFSTGLKTGAAKAVAQGVGTGALHIDLDGAWNTELLEEQFPGLETWNGRAWGPRLRFTTPRREMERFYGEVRPFLAPYLLYGSGDFHHLAALWLRRWEEPFTLVSFDNHPDWDTRPPHWCCGSWVSRALGLPMLEEATVWGCGNFELEWPGRLFANHRGLRSGRLKVRPWSERLTAPQRWPSLRRENWRDAFLEYAKQLTGRQVYITVDLDCLRAEEAATNWENGLFYASDVAWALEQLHRHAGKVIGGDLCGAFSPPAYARLPQRVAATWDHPKIVPFATTDTRNLETLHRIWPALIGETAADLPVLGPTQASWPIDIGAASGFQ